MIKTSIEMKNGIPHILADGKLYYPMAYTSYFEERGEYSDFIKSGYRMFFVNVSFTTLPINNVTGFSPFRTGVFEGDEPDYSEFDNIVCRIVSECPDAMIFPRINIAMPKKWVDSHPEETVETPTGNRESLFSDVFRQDGERLLKILVDHILSSDYSERIAGYQLCGGSTQEWIHHDLSGSYSEKGLEKFRLWMNEKYGVRDVPDFCKSDYDKPEFQDIVSRFGEFGCMKTAGTVEYFAKALKEHINSRQIVGVFYGYNAFVNDYMWGLLGLRHLLGSSYIDFFSSPCCYDNNRALGIDWGDMLASASVKQHKKLYFVECDIRTHLTRRMQEGRKGEYSDEFYGLYDKDGNKTVWCGPESTALSLSAVRKAFSRQLVNGSGIWWFDMWGGWYHDSEIMAELKKMKTEADSQGENNTDGLPSAETVVFIDEKAYFRNPRISVFRHSVNHTRLFMGNTGIPFDLYMTEDAKQVLHKYKAAIFTAPLPSDSGREAVELCRKLGIPCLEANEDEPFFSEARLRDFLVENGVHCYNPDGNVIYCGNGFVGIHTKNEGKVIVRLPEKFRVRPLFGDFSETDTDTLTLNMKKYETAVFSLRQTE